MTTLTHSPAIATYAAQVRAALDGVEQDVVDELTEGLEADLTEAVLDDLELVDGGAGLLDGAPGAAQAALTTLDGEALRERFGSPGRYAAELAAAAGVAVPVVLAVPQRRRVVRDGLAAVRFELRGAVEAFAARHGWVRSAAEFFRVLRPVWWVARGWGLFVVMSGIVGGEVLRPSAGGWLLLTVAVVASVQWGRGAFWQGRWGRRAGLLLSWIAGVGVLAGWAGLPSVASGDGYWNDGYAAGAMDAEAAYAGTTAGVWVEGEAATNLFVFDAAGNPVEAAQIVDQSGRPVVLGPNGGPSWAPWASWEEWLDSGMPDGPANVPLGALDSQVPLGVFPYSFVPFDSLRYDEAGRLTLPAGVSVLAPRWPAATLLPVPGVEVGGTDQEAAPSGVVGGTRNGGAPDTRPPEPATSATPDPTDAGAGGTASAGGAGSTSSAVPEGEG